MELKYLLNEEKATRRTYRHFTINTSGTEAATVKKLEFFYIGKKSENIDILIRSFESGYAAENISNAKAMLTRLMGSKDRQVAVPDVIIADISVDTEGLQELNRFLASNKILAAIPFVAEASGAHPADIERFRNFTFIDEIIFLKDYNKTTIHRKVSFLKKVKERQVNEFSNTTISNNANARKVSGVIFKRAFDITVSSLILLAASPVMLFVALAIKLESRGPVFYISKRAGRGYKIFDFYKFRTMQADADTKVKDFSHLNQYNTNQTQGPVFFKINNDPRITKIGNFLRNTSLDELPQLLNVLKGDMSLVGNRPLPLYEAATLTTDEWAKRFMAPAGMTGLWQIKKRGKDEMSVEERITLDIDYADKYSFLYDLWIMANTPSALLQKSNA